MGEAFASKKTRFEDGVEDVRGHQKRRSVYMTID